jgi:LPXTG-motif cell wall-anchored protein
VHYGVDGEESDGLSAGAKAGIAIGVIIGVAIVAAVAWFFWRRRKGAMVSQGKEGYELTPDGAAR